MGSAIQCARVIVDELISRGITDVVLAPGSRSAPLAYELHAADRIDLIRLHVRIDERGAGFLALGLAKASEQPVAVVTTSGTAVANLHPAVLEAAHSGIKLIMITADRPRSMINTGANQTTNQTRVFGEHARAEVQLDDTHAGADWWRFEVSRLVEIAAGNRTRDPGPVHLNVSFSEPLTPEQSDRDLAESHFRGDLRIEPGWVPALPTVLDPGPQTVIVAGDLPPGVGRDLATLAETAKIPLLAEPSSNARGGGTALSTGRLLLSSNPAVEIERVIVVGHPTLSRPVSRLLARDDVELIVVADRARWIDPGLRASLVTHAIQIGGVGQSGEADDEWFQRWAEIDRVVSSDLAALLRGEQQMSGPTVAATVWGSLDSHDTLVAGSSNPIRDLDLAPHRSDPPAVYANRGLAGIDGTISTAIGIALAVERPTHALLGDLTFLHDLNALVIGPDEPRPDLRLVVANDDGGSIFATLEHGQPTHLGAFERVFGTPHHADLAQLVTGTGAGFRRVDDQAVLQDVLAEPPIGIEVVEAVIDRSQRRTLNKQFAELAADF